MYKRLFYTGLFVLALSLCGCERKPVRKITDTHKVNEWVYTQMSRNYLWSASLPDKGKTDLSAKTESYFESLRNAADRFSKIEYTGDGEPKTRARAAATEKDYDFGWLLVKIIDKYTEALDHFQILYVAPGSPAEKAGLQRGDAFDEINGTGVTNSNYQSLLAASSIEIKVLNPGREGMVSLTKGEYYNQPILVNRIYETPEKTAYLMYNHFTDGDASAGYSRKLKDAFAAYRDAGVENLILDLRYNGGGEIENARLLASLIAPRDVLGEEFMRLERNSSDKWEGFEVKRFILNSQMGNSNADIKNLYIITSENTASASELIIYTLKPFYEGNIHVIGQKTVGKNVGSVTYTNSQYDWEISPITVRVYNINGESDYAGGIEPDLPHAGLRASEYVSSSYAGEPASRYWLLPELGDYEHEALLNFTMSRFFGIAPAYDFDRMWASSGSRALGGLEPIPMVPQRGLTEGQVIITE